jgi:hypothetical protein
MIPLPSPSLRGALDAPRSPGVAVVAFLVILELTVVSVPGKRRVTTNDIEHVGISSAVKIPLTFSAAACPPRGRSR